MLKFIGSVVGIALFCWATASAFSIFSELKFLVDGWTWSVDQVPTSIKAIALTIGKYVSGVFGGYREFVHWLVQTLRLPKLPQVVCDVAGTVAFSIAGGRWIAKRAHASVYKFDFTREWNIDEVGRLIKERLQHYPIKRFTDAFAIWIEWHLPRKAEDPDEPPDLRNYRYSLFVANAIVYGGLVAVVIAAIIAALFGIDYLYRHVDDGGGGRIVDLGSLGGKEGLAKLAAYSAAWWRLGVDARFDFGVHPHMLRHATGYKLANDGGDTRSLQAYLGHVSIVHTTRYTEMSATRFKDFLRDERQGTCDASVSRTPIRRSTEPRPPSPWS
jgi:Phage integrase family